MTTASLTALLTVFLVRALGPRQYGVFALTVGMSAIAVALADLGISDSTARFVAERRGRSGIGALVADTLKLKMVVTGLLCAVFAALASFIAGAYGNPELVWPLRAIALATLGQSTYAMLLGVSTALGRAVINVRLVAAESLIEVSASVALVLIGTGAAGAAFGRAIGYVAGAAIAAYVVLRLSGHERSGFWRLPQRETVRRVTGYAGPMFAIDVSYTFSASLTVLLVGAYLGSAASGTYQAPLKFITLIQYVGLSTASGVAPRLARGEGQEPDVTALNRALRGLIGFQCLALAPAVVWSGPITRLLLGSGYPQSAAVLTALAPYVFFCGLVPLATTSVSYLGEAGRRVPIAFATLALIAVGGVILIPSHGVVGAAIATDIAFGFYTLAHLWLCRRLLQLRIGMLIWSLASGLTAAAAMGIVLSAVGTSHLTIFDWVKGGAGGLAAFTAMMIFTREIRGADIARVSGKTREIVARLPFASPPRSSPKPRPPAQPGSPAPIDVVGLQHSAVITGRAAGSDILPGSRDFADATAGLPVELDAPVMEPVPTAGSEPRPGERFEAVDRAPAARRGFLRRRRDQFRAARSAAPSASSIGAHGQGPRSPAATPPGWVEEVLTSPAARPARRLGQDQSDDPERPSKTFEPAPDVTEAPQDVVYQITWRLDDDAGVFELLSEDQTDADHTSKEQSPSFPWGWRMAPAPMLEARRAHDELVERLLLAGWRRAGLGDAWFAHRFRPPYRPSSKQVRHS